MSHWPVLAGLAAAALICGLIIYQRSGPVFETRPLAANLSVPLPITRRLADGSIARLKADAEIEEIYRLRVLLEGHAAGAAAVSATEAQLSELEDIAQRLDQIVIGSNPPALEQIADLNNRFHKLIVSAAGSPRLESALASIIEIPLVLRTFQRYEVAELRRSAKQHLELVSALRARDADWARSVMASHILSAQHALLRATR